ncbi:MAG TPA: class I SAM-dependent methyltransferase [Candidatus Binatia bacterium]|nr:class I SAM-dependent methyltransferase [Candidatus Binatia bacterium]
MSRHPRELDWANVSLPDTWPDRLDMKRLRSVARLLVHLARRRHAVSIPSDLQGREYIPAYVLQEFHNLPNGNYSNLFTRGYISGFDLSMLGHMQRIRRLIGEKLAGCASVLDLGCGGGATAAAIHDAGASEVWGLDPSPYLLRHAAKDHPAIRFVHGVMEDLPFPDACFDAVSVCFAFHEVPPPSIRVALSEIARVLRPGAWMMIAEPSPAQFRTSLAGMIYRYGWQGLWFGMLARLMHEPYLGAWHEFALEQEAAARGMRVVEEVDASPVRWWLLRRDG